jgi:hypothetical protein
MKELDAGSQCEVQAISIGPACSFVDTAADIYTEVPGSNRAPIIVV